MIGRTYTIRVENFDFKNDKILMIKALRETTGCNMQEALNLMKKSPFTIEVNKQNVERVAEALKHIGATITIEGYTQDTTKSNLDFNHYAQPTTSPVVHNIAVSNETLALKNYLKDVYLLERQLYTYEQISCKYERTYENIKKEKEKKLLYKYDEFRGEDANRGDNRQLLSPKALREQYKTITYSDFNGWEWEWIPDSWRQELGETLKVAKSIGCGAEILRFLAFPFIGAIVGGLLFHNGILGGILGLIAFGIIAYMHTDDSDRGGKNYEKFITLYKEKYEKDLKEKEPYLEVKIKFIEKECQESVIPNINQTEAILNKVYSANIIHPKYRNFVAVSQIYEYFETGRCSELEGPNGAYNLYENELRLNTIIDKLDIIISQLATLNATMGMVVSAINYSNSMLSDISSSLGRIEANTALTAYNSQCIAFNTDLSSRY